jgi:DNA repair protein RecO (recombination protein O)
MRDRRCRALVLRRIPYGDTSLVLHVFSRELGRFGLIARGARRPRSPLDSVLQTAQLVDLQLQVKEGRELQLLKEADLVDDWRGLRRDYARLLGATGVCELLERTQLPDQPDEPLFETAQAVIGVLAGDCPWPLNPVYWFLFYMLAHSGFGLDFEHCGACGRETAGFAGQDGAALDRRGGLFTCPDCRPGSEVLDLPPRLLRVLRFLAECGPEGAAQREITLATRVALGDWLEALAAIHFERWRPLNSLAELAKLS